MRQPGRISAAAMATATPRDRKSPRLEPPSFLSDAGRLLFIDLVASCEARHFVRSDVELLATFVACTLVVRQTAGNLETFNQWEKAARLQASLATRLRLTPSSRLDPKTVGRNVPSGHRFPWESDAEHRARLQGLGVEQEEDSSHD